MCKIFYVLFLFIVLSNEAYCQYIPGKKDFHTYLSKAHELKNSGKYFESLKEIDKAIKIGNKTSHLIDANVFKAELFRLTAQHKLAFKLLWDIKISEESLQKYSSLTYWYLKRYGRLAALHHESGAYRTDSDSIYFYIRKGLDLARKHPIRFRYEIASLENEYGFYVYRKGFGDEAVEYYTSSSKTFKELGKTEEYVNVMGHLLEYSICNPEKMPSASIEQKLLEVKNNEKWYLTNSRTFGLLALSAGERNDSTKYWKYKSIQLENQSKYENASSNKRFQELAKIYETENLEQEIDTKDKELIKKDAKAYEIILFLIVTLFLLAIGGVLLTRERKLKKRLKLTNSQLTVSNNKYQMLVSESNHRIKNNLQMIISMLNFSRSENSKEGVILDKISGKIETISALHRLLNFESHNEKVNTRIYLDEIIENYQKMHDYNFNIEKHFDNIEMESERLIYFGLILNELISNTIEHREDSQKSINVSVTKQVKTCTFEYEDGACYPEKLKYGKGIQLIEGLIDRLGCFNYEFNPEKGSYKFEFYA